MKTSIKALGYLSSEAVAEISETWPAFRSEYCRLKGISQEDFGYLLQNKLIKADDFLYDLKVMEGNK